MAANRKRCIWGRIQTLMTLTVLAFSSRADCTASAENTNLSHAIEQPMGGISGALDNIDKELNEMKSLLLVSSRDSLSGPSSEEHLQNIVSKLKELVDCETETLKKMTSQLQPVNCTCNGAPVVYREAPIRKSLKRVPWLASIYEKTKEKKIVHTCSGALIDHSYVLTAATCFSRSRSPANFIVLLAPIHGSLRANRDDHAIIKSKVGRILLHPEYSKGDPNFKGNLALVKLIKRVPQNRKNVAPVPIAADDVVPGETAEVFGFYNLPNGTISEVVGEDVKVLDEQQCAQNMGKTPTSEEFCAVSSADPVPLQSFGSVPFVVQQGEHHFLKGIFSHGKHTVDYPQVFISTSRFSKWIQSKISNADFDMDDMTDN